MATNKEIEIQNKLVDSHEGTIAMLVNVRTFVKSGVFQRVPYRYMELWVLRDDAWHMLSFASSLSTTCDTVGVCHSGSYNPLLRCYEAGYFSCFDECFICQQQDHLA